MDVKKDTIAKTNKRLSAVVPIDVYDKLTELAEKEERSVAYLVNKALKEYLNMK